MRRLNLGPAIATACVAMAPMAHAAFDQNITPDVIMGTGIANGGWTTDTNSNVELGLRARVRYDLVTNLPTNVTNSNGDGSYNHAAGSPPSPASRARWNFDWSINTNVNGLGDAFLKLDDLQFGLFVDYDPTLGESGLLWDPINGNNPIGTLYWDHSFGTNATLNGQGVEIAGAPGNPTALVDYAAAIDTYTVAQNSWNYDFFDGLANFGGSVPGVAFNPSANGDYVIGLAAFQGSTQVAATRIRVIVGTGAVPVPEPGALALLSVGLIPLLLLLRRHVRTA